MLPRTLLAVSLVAAIATAGCRITTTGRSDWPAPRSTRPVASPAPAPAGIGPDHPSIAPFEVRLGDATTLRFHTDRHRLCTATFGSTTLDMAAPDSTSLVSGGRVPYTTEVVRAALDGPEPTVELHLTRSEEPHADPVGRRLVETISAVTIGDALGYRRAVRQDPRFDPHRDGREYAPVIVFGPDRFARLGPPTPIVEDHYGWSTVSESGLTYDLWTFDRGADGVVWVFRAHHHLMNQAVNARIDLVLDEVVLLAPVGSTLAAEDVVRAFVTQQHDVQPLLDACAGSGRQSASISRIAVSSPSGSNPNGPGPQRNATFLSWPTR